MNPIENGLSRRERERLDRQLAMLNAAKDLFAEKGYAGATLEEIAARAEFGKGTLYNYFPGGKKQILLAIFDQLYDGLCELIEESFRNDNRESFRDTMESFIANCFQFFYERFNLFVILVKEAEQLIFSDDVDRVTYFVRQQSRVLETLSVPLRLAMNRGDLREMPPELFAHMLMVNLKGYQMRNCPRNRSEKGELLETPTPEQAAFLTDFILFGASSKHPVEVAK